MQQTFASEAKRRQLAQAIRAAVEDQSVTLETLSERSGVHRSQLCRFSQGHFKRTSENLLATCNALGIDWAPYLRQELNRPKDVIEAAVNEVWDGSTEHAQRLARVIRAVGPVLSS